MMKEIVDKLNQKKLFIRQNRCKTKPSVSRLKHKVVHIGRFMGCEDVSVSPVATSAKKTMNCFRTVAVVFT